MNAPNGPWWSLCDRGHWCLVNLGLATSIEAEGPDRIVVRFMSGDRMEFDGTRNDFRALVQGA